MTGRGASSKVLANMNIGQNENSKSKDKPFCSILLIVLWNTD